MNVAEAGPTRWSAGIGTRFAWRRDLHRDTMLLLGFATGLLAGTGRFDVPPDALAYWEAGTSSSLYPESWAQQAHGYLFYPPPIVQLSMLFQPLGWGVFIAILMTATFGAMWYCARNWSLPLLLVGVPYLSGLGPRELASFLGFVFQGNIQWILAALTIVALRHPALWAVEFVTKVTAAIGWWWHVLRGEWRQAAMGAGVSLGIIGLSVVVSPSMWADYLGFAARNFTAANPPVPAFPIPFGVRLATGIPLLVWGARTNRAWTVPIVCGWCLVAVFGLSFLPFWLAGAHLFHWPLVEDQHEANSIETMAHTD